MRRLYAKTEIMANHFHASAKIEQDRAEVLIANELRLRLQRRAHRRRGGMPCPLVGADPLAALPLGVQVTSGRWCCFCGGQGHLSYACPLKKG